MSRIFFLTLFRFQDLKSSRHIDIVDMNILFCQTFWANT
uniref:Uncharacterized protein n=1 Tax=Arundo donax TaxID=35708 RepID=A0A0A9F1G0_ARUDO